jgi:poly(glycerol-phosphate) alpha-glucosyltransferase
LVILEALARGCPVVSYDIKYGPREQIDDGVTGFLAPAGDHVTLGTQCLRLLSSPDLVSRMARAGQAHVRRDHDQYVGRWSNILRACVDAAPRRTWVRDIELVVNKIGWGAAGKSRRVPLAPPVIGFRGTLSVKAAPSDTPLSDAVIELEAVADETGVVVPLPINVVGPDDGVFIVGCTFNLANVSAKASNGSVDLRLRLRFTWQNSYWETDVHGGWHPGRRYEVSYLDDGTVRLRARPRTRRPLRELIRRGPGG